jgi:hypothetical protein
MDIKEEEKYFTSFSTKIFSLVDLDRSLHLIQGLDMQKFNSCFDSQKCKSFVEHDITLGASFGHLLKPVI